MEVSDKSSVRGVDHVLNLNKKTFVALVSTGKDKLRQRGASRGVEEDIF